MAVKKGILLTSDMQPAIAVKRLPGGEIETGWIVANTHLQNMMIILYSAKGEIKQDPMMGVGLNAYIEQEDNQTLVREIRSQMYRDGQPMPNINIKDKTIDIITSI